MNRVDEKRIYRKAFDKWGVDAQLSMLMEESAELIQATNKVIRSGGTIESYNKLAEEIADVEILIDQLKVIVTWQRLKEKVMQHRIMKLKRLQMRLAQ